MATEIPVDRIRVTARQRPVDPKVVADLARSIESHGLLQPIGVKPLDGSGYELIFGAHRLEAFKLLQCDTIPASVWAADLSTEESRLIELRENLDRNDLTGAQRKAFAAEVGRLIAKLHAESVANGNGNGDKNGNERWLRDLAEGTGTPVKTMYNWWNAFVAAVGVAITPKQASANQRDQFFDWLEERLKEDRRQAEEAKARQREAVRQELLARLDEAAAECGIVLVREWVDVWLRREHP